MLLLVCLFMIANERYFFCPKQVHESQSKDCSGWNYTGKEDFIQDCIYCNWGENQTKVWTQFHWNRGWGRFISTGVRKRTLAVFANWLFLACTFGIGGYFIMWRKAFTEGRLLSCPRDWEIGISDVLFSLMFTYQRHGSQIPEKCSFGLWN